MNDKNIFNVVKCILCHDSSRDANPEFTDLLISMTKISNTILK